MFSIKLLLGVVTVSLGRDFVHETRNTATGQPRISRYFCAVGGWRFCSATELKHVNWKHGIIPPNKAYWIPMHQFLNDEDSRQAHYSGDGGQMKVLMYRTDVLRDISTTSSCPARKGFYGLIRSARHPDACLIYKINSKICVWTCGKGTPTGGAVARSWVPFGAASNRPVARKPSWANKIVAKIS